MGRVNKRRREILTSVGVLRLTQVILTVQVGLLLLPSGNWRRNRDRSIQIIRKDLVRESLQQAFLLLDVRVTCLQRAVSGLDVLAIFKVHL